MSSQGLSPLLCSWGQFSVGLNIDTAALLARVDIVEVIDSHVPLTKDGAEYKACCPFHSEKTPSFKVSPDKQIYHCFGCGANGDAIAFLQAYQGISFREACAALGADTKVIKALAKAGGRGNWLPVSPVPDSAPEAPKAHYYRGVPSHIWDYRDGTGRLLGHVCRFATSSGGKEILPLTYCRHVQSGKQEWKWVAFAEPRPLYGHDRLAAQPDAFVLVVEGEKCADAAQAELPELVVVSWPGGGKAVGKVDWSPLANRKVGGWADCDAKRAPLTRAEREATPDDVARAAVQAEKPLLPVHKQPGVAAMNKIASAVMAAGGRWWDISIPAPGEKPDGWDIADAIAEGMAGQKLAGYIRDNLQQRELPPAATSAGAGKKNKTSKKETWIPDLIWGRDVLKSCMQNVYQILANAPEWKDVLAYNEFSLVVEKLKAPPFPNGKTGEWDSTDDSLTAIWLSRYNAVFKFSPATNLVAEAVETLAHEHKYHPVRNWFKTLQWDGTERLSCFPEDYLGTLRTEYTMRVFKWWMMGAVKRILQPGVKFDYCLVLCGPQGKKKSAVFEVLAGEWFGETELDLSNKDSMSALRGKFIYEIAEMGALMRAEERRQKSFLSRRIDEYRPVYGRREIKAPRQVVFAGTTNEHEFNKDQTGGRRFWPLDVTVDEIELAAVAAVREQLWAEAVALVQAGEKYWPDAEEQRQHFDPAQLRAEQSEALIDALHDWVYLQIQPFTLYQAASDGLNIDASKLTRDLQTRIGIALRKLGCGRIERRNGMTRFLYTPPGYSDQQSMLPAHSKSGANNVAL